MNTLFKFKKADGFDVFYLDYDNELMQLTYTQSEFILYFIPYSQDFKLQYDNFFVKVSGNSICFHVELKSNDYICFNDFCVFHHLIKDISSGCEYE